MVSYDDFNFFLTHKILIRAFHFCIYIEIDVTIINFTIKYKKYSDIFYEINLQLNIRREKDTTN